MAQYLPSAPDGVATPGPTDFIYQHNGPTGDTFRSAYLTLMPYITVRGSGGEPVRQPLRPSPG